MNSITFAAFKNLFSPFKSIPSVCDLSHENKVTLCWSYLKSEEYKFEFSLKIQNDSLNTKCDYRKLSLRILDQRQLTLDQLWMFRCPQIAEDFFLREAPIFYISDSGWKSVAIIFKQKNSRAAIHPHKYLREIDFDELNLRTEVFIQEKLPVSLKKSLWYRDVANKQLISTDFSDYKFNLFQRSIDATEINERRFALLKIGI